MMIHLDFGVDDLEAGVVWAIEIGARLADHQPQEHVRVMLDPEGHPFCLFADKHWGQQPGQGRRMRVSPGVGESPTPRIAPR